MKALALLAGALFVAAPLFAQDKMDAKDARALRHLIEGNLAEVEIGKLAEEKAQGQQVKDFAKRMVDDHSKMAQELQGLAQQKGVKAPEDAGVKHQALAKKLQVSKNFDQAYMAEMVKDHQKDIREVQKIAREAKDADLKAAARKAAPAMQAHLKLAQSITGGKSSAGR